MTDGVEWNMGEWKKTWGYVPVNWGTDIGTVENITQKLWLRNGLNGTALRVKFSNLYDAQPLVMERVTVGRWDRETEEITDIRAVTCQGKEKIAVEPGSFLWSDVISVSVAAADDLVLSVYLKESHTFSGLCQTWNAKSWRSSFQTGDRTGSNELSGMATIDLLPFFQFDEHVSNGALGICGVEVLTEEKVVTIACFGDSITHMSYYFDPLLEALYRRYPGQVALLNCGIGGNRVLYDACYVEEIPGHGKCFGEAAVNRFERDVYEDTKPDLVFVMEGVNDCSHGFAFDVPGEVPTGAQLFEGIRKIVETGRAKGSRVYVSTIMPFGCYEEPFRERAEAIRQSCNELLRERREIADGFLDLDAVMRKEEDPHFMKDGMHLGDGVHPGEAGGREIAAAILEACRPVFAAGHGSRKQ